MESPKKHGQPTAKRGSERRSTQRVDTSRAVLFTKYNSSGPLNKGVAVDMSASGMRIRTQFPEAQGTDLHIELPPPPDNKREPVVFLRGRVRYVAKLDTGEYDMGVRLALKNPLAASKSRPRK